MSVTLDEVLVVVVLRKNTVKILVLVGEVFVVLHTRKKTEVCRARRVMLFFHLMTRAALFLQSWGKP